MFSTFIRTKFDVFGTFENFDPWGLVLSQGVIYYRRARGMLKSVTSILAQLLIVPGVSSAGTKFSTSTLYSENGGVPLTSIIVKLIL